MAAAAQCGSVTLRVGDEVAYALASSNEIPNTECASVYREYVLSANRLLPAYPPTVIPRNHLVEEAISAAVNNSDFAPFEELIAMLARPYDDLSASLTGYGAPPQPEQVVRQTFCGT